MGWEAKVKVKKARRRDGLLIFAGGGEMSAHRHGSPADWHPTGSLAVVRWS